jgi:hypothetical protein
LGPTTRARTVTNPETNVAGIAQGTSRNSTRQSPRKYAMANGPVLSEAREIAREDRDQALPLLPAFGNGPGCATRSTDPDARQRKWRNTEQVETVRRALSRDT